MRQDLHSQIPQLLILLREIILDHPEHIFEAELIQFFGAGCLEVFVDDVHGEAGNLSLVALHALDKLRVQKTCLISLNHDEENFEADVSEVGLVRGHFL